MSPSKISWEDISPKEGLRSAAQQPKPHPQPFPLFLVGSKMQPLLALCSLSAYGLRYLPDAIFLPVPPTGESGENVAMQHLVPMEMLQCDS